MPDTKTSVTYEDNMACTCMSKPAAMYHEAHHMDTRVYHRCKKGVMELEKVEMALQVADSFTKAAQQPLFNAHSSVLMEG